MPPRGRKRQSSSPFSNTTASDRRKVKFRSQVSEIEPFNLGRQSPAWDRGPRNNSVDREGQVGSQPENEEGEEDEVLDLQRRILTFHAPYEGCLAATFYDPETRRIQVLEDTKDTSGWDLAQVVLEQTRPQMVVLTAQTHRNLVVKVEQYQQEYRCQVTNLNKAGSTLSNASYHLGTLILPGQEEVLEKSGDFDERKSSSSVSYNGTWREEGAGMGKRRLNILKVGCWVNIDAPAAIIATGILVNFAKQDYVQTLRDKAREAWNDELTIASIESMQWERHMVINKDALTSLAIFDTEAHAFVHAEKNKDAASIFGLLNQTETPLGRKLLHTWHLRPLLDIEEINARHDAVQLFSAPHNVHIMEEMKKILRNVNNVPRILTRIRYGRANWRDWKGLTDAITACHSVSERSWSLGIDRDIPIIYNVREMITEDLQKITYDIGRVIDWDASREEKRVKVRPGLDAELDAWRRDYQSMFYVLESTAAKEGAEVPYHPNILSKTAVYFPQLGHHMVLHVTPDMEIDSVPQVSGWEPRFNTDDMYYYKTPATLQLDEHFGDPVTLINEREIVIVQALTEQIKNVELDVLRMCDLIAELDCLLALATAATNLGLRRPTMVEEPVLDIYRGKHLLQEVWTGTESFITNDAHLQGGPPGGSHSSMMVVTGPNGSGKSVYGKQIALIIYMAQIGSFVPADRADLGICDKIFTRLQTRESSSKNASAFMIDLAQVSQALRGATERSLILLDEFGKGTAPTDGAGLLAGVIEQLMRAPRPRTIILTHFHELFTHQFISPDLGIKLCHMESILFRDSLQLQYLFRVRNGMSNRSYAAECATQHGIPKEIVDRARFITQCVSNFETDKIYDETLTPFQRREIDAMEELAVRFLTWRIDDDDELGVNPIDKLRKMMDDIDEEFKLTEGTSFVGTGSSVAQGYVVGEEESVQGSDLTD